MPPPISSTISRMVMPIGTSIRPPRLILPASAKTLVPLLVARAERGERVGAVAEDPRHAGERLDVVDERRLAAEAALGRVGRPQPRHAALPFERLDQRGLLAADERAGAFAHLEAQRECRCRRMSRPEEAALLRPAAIAVAHALHGQRVLGADVEDSLRRRRSRTRRWPGPRARGAGRLRAPGGP